MKKTYTYILLSVIKTSTTKPAVANLLAAVMASLLGKAREKLIAAATDLLEKLP